MSENSLGVSLSMREHICEQLIQLQSERAVRVLFAAESGSRAWGFASPNSDYDVRFLYVPQPKWYYHVSAKRDVIESMLPNDIDLSGWELRKALRLFKRYNGALYEWLGSPIQYVECGATASHLRTLMAAMFKPAAALHHYGSMAQAALLAMPETGPVSSKKLCYLLRALFACRHILHERSQPATEFATLREKHTRDRAEADWIAALLAAKAQAPEKALTEINSQQRQAFAAEIEQALAARSHIGGAKKSPPDALDKVLLEAIEKAWC
jgi:uncharacterized protein